MTTEEIDHLLSTFNKTENYYNSLLAAIPDLLFLMDIEGYFIKFQPGKGFVFIPLTKS